LPGGQDDAGRGAPGRRRPRPPRGVGARLAPGAEREARRVAVSRRAAARETLPADRDPLGAEVALAARRGGTQGARERVVPPRLPASALLVERAREREVRVVVGRRQLDELAKLCLRLAPAVDAEVGDAERLADRRLLRLAPLGLLQRDGRLGRASGAQVRAPLLEEVVGLAHARLASRRSTSSSTAVATARF